MDEIKVNFDFDIKYFDINLNFKDNFNSRYVKPKYRYVNENKILYKNAKKMAQEITIEKNERIYCIIDGLFIFGDFIEAYIVEKNLSVKKLTISTLSCSQENVDSLQNLITGNYVDELNLMISAYFYSHEKHVLIPYIYENLDIDNKFQLAVSSSHMKTCLIETYCGKKIVIHGSANLRSSSNIEQIMIEENEDLYNFNDEILNSIFETYKTINKPLRRQELWQRVDQKKNLEKQN